MTFPQHSRSPSLCACVLGSIAVLCRAASSFANCLFVGKLVYVRQRTQEAVNER
jgi:hypothetical protein